MFSEDAFTFTAVVSIVDRKHFFSVYWTKPVVSGEGDKVWRSRSTYHMYELTSNTNIFE